MDSEKNLLLHTKYYTLQYSYTTFGRWFRSETGISTRIDN